MRSFGAFLSYIVLSDKNATIKAMMLCNTYQEQQLPEFVTDVVAEDVLVVVALVVVDAVLAIVLVVVGVVSLDVLLLHVLGIFSSVAYGWLQWRSANSLGQVTSS